MKLTIFGLVTVLGITAQAATEERTKVLKDENHTIAVDVKAGDVRCSDLGYSNIQLKMSVPDLKWISQLDHTNPGEAQPCMSSGRCRPGNTPEEMIGGKPGIENTVLHRVLTENAIFDRATGDCSRSIVETVEMTVRGKKFAHRRSLDLGNQSIGLCEQL